MEIKFKMEVVREVTINISAKDLDNLTSVLVQLQEHGAEEVRSLNAVQIDKLHFGEALEKQESFVIPHGSSPVKLEHLVPALLAKLQSDDKPTLRDSTADLRRPAMKFIGDDIVPPFIGTKKQVASHTALWSKYPFGCVLALRQALGTRDENEVMNEMMEDTDSSSDWTTPSVSPSKVQSSPSRLSPEKRRSPEKRFSPEKAQ